MKGSEIKGILLLILFTQQIIKKQITILKQKELQEKIKWKNKWPRKYTHLRVKSEWHEHATQHIQQNPVNPTCMGQDRWQNIKYSGLSDSTYTDLQS
jgi:hypothetical protein